MEKLKRNVRVIAIFEEVCLGVTFGSDSLKCQLLLLHQRQFTELIKVPHSGPVLDSITCGSFAFYLN